jgi:hypothetical protein
MQYCQSKSIYTTKYVLIQICSCANMRYCKGTHYIVPSSFTKCKIFTELPSLTVYLWVSSFSRWPLGLTVGVENLTEPLKWSFMHGILHLCSEQNTICKNTVCSFKENLYKFVKWHFCQKISSMAIRVNLDFVILKYNAI